MKMNRVFLKLSGEALAGPKKTGFDEDTVKEVARQVKLSVDAGVQVGIVIGGGNFWNAGMQTEIFTPFACGTMTQLFSKDQANKCFAEGKVVFFAGGTGHPYFSTDTGITLRAIEMEADCILLAKAIDGVYDHFHSGSDRPPVSSCRSDRVYYVHGTQDANGCIQLK